MANKPGISCLLHIWPLQHKTYCVLKMFWGEEVNIKGKEIKERQLGATIYYPLTSNQPAPKKLQQNKTEQNNKA